MIGSSPAFERMRNTARLVAGTDVGVLLLGEPGSGRETLAREIHAQGPRAGGPFVVFNCTGAPDGALLECLGEVSPARGTSAGTFYLDEVGELSREAQARLFHAIDAGDHGAGGATRVIAASALDSAPPWRAAASVGTSICGSAWFPSRFRPCVSESWTSPP